MTTQKRYRASILILTILVFLFSGTTKTLAKSVSGNSAKLNYTKKTMNVGSSLKLKVKNGTGFSFTSSNKRVAVVDKSSGKVKAKAKGKATITAKKGKTKLTCKLTVQQPVDVIIFAGQSNMMGYGNSYEAPKVTKGAGYLYNPITNKNALLAFEEYKGKPFGLGQDDHYLNNTKYGNISPRGSLVSSFINSYYAKTKTPIIAVPASEAGSGSGFWVATGYKGVIQRGNAAIKVAKKKGLTVRHVYMVWLQGENDAFAYLSANERNANMKSIYTKIHKKAPVEKVLMINIPPFYGDEEHWPETNIDAIKENYVVIQNANRAICKSNKNFVMISDLATTFPAEWMYSDGIHLTQYALNQLGADAGSKAGAYVNKQK